MTNGLELFLSVSLSGGVIALILLALRPLLKNKLGKAWQYYIWLIVALRLLLPFSPEVSLSGALFSALPAQTETASSGTPQLTDAFAAPVNTEAANHADPVSNTGGENEAAPPRLGGESVGRSAPALSAEFSASWILAALLMGAAIMAIWRTTGYLLFMRRLRQSARKPDEATQKLYFSLCRELGIKRPPVLISAKVGAPMLAGVFHPVIALPKGAASGAEQILLHELIHHKRKDTLYKLFFAATLCLHWFNPAVWLAARSMAKDCELCCDEAVMEISGEGYGEVLLSFAQCRSPKNALCLSEGGKIMKERLQAVKNFAKGKKRPVFIIAIVTAAIVVCAVFMGAAKPSGGQELRFSTATVSNDGELKVEDNGVQGVIYSTSQPSIETTIKTDTDKIKYDSASESDLNTKYGGEPTAEPFEPSTGKLPGQGTEGPSVPLSNSYSGPEQMLRDAATIKKADGEVFYPKGNLLFIAGKLNNDEVESIYAISTPENPNRSDVKYINLFTDLSKCLTDKLFEFENGQEAPRNAALLIIEDGILFDSGKDNIRDEYAEDGLKEIADVLKKYEDKIETIRVIGHTDNNPINTEEFPDNFDLSSKRANNVVRFLADAGDLDSSLLESIGYGENMPIATNDTAEGRQQNRRIEIFVGCKN